MCCNIVGAPCKICGKILPLHLGDYDTSPEEVEMFCQDHLPCHDIRIFTLTEDDDEYPAYTKFGIRSLTDNARKNKDKNHPNIGADWMELDLDSKGKEVPIVKKTRAEQEKEFKEFIKQLKSL
jgi:hypothetical protein